MKQIWLTIMDIEKNKKIKKKQCRPYSGKISVGKRG